MADLQTIKVYAERAEEYAGLIGSDGPDADLIAFLDMLPNGARILDLGCGPAHASAHMRSMGHHPDPVDACAEMVDLANRLYSINARLGTFDELGLTAPVDAVWANFSLLHAPRADLPRHLADIAAALRPDGVLHLGMKLGDGAARDGLGRSYTYVTENDLVTLVQNAGLVPVARRFGSDTGLAGTLDPFIILRARKPINA